jgi:hypothetical protein
VFEKPEKRSLAHTVAIVISVSIMFIPRLNHIVHTSGHPIVLIKKGTTPLSHHFVSCSYTIDLLAIVTGIPSHM